MTPDELALMDAMFAAADRKAERRRRKKDEALKLAAERDQLLARVAEISAQIEAR